MDSSSNQNPTTSEQDNPSDQSSLTPDVQTQSESSSQFPKSSEAREPVDTPAVPSLAKPQVVQSQPPQAEVTQQPMTQMDSSGYSDQPAHIVVSDHEVIAEELPKKSNSKMIIISVGILVIIALGGIGHYFLTKTTPLSVFNKTLSKALSTSQVEQTTTGGGSSSDIKYNLANIQNPVTSSSVSIGIFGITYNLNSYGTRNNSFVDYTSITVGGVTENNSTTAPFLNKWVQVRNDGTLPAGDDSDLDQLIDPHYQLFGQYIFGNFTSSERNSLLSYIESNNIYQFSAKNVTKGVLNGSKVFIYPVSLNLAKLTTLNDKVASMLGFSSSDTQNINQSISSGPKSATLYIDPTTDRLLQVKATTQGTTATINYSNYNDLTLPQQPKPQLTWAQFTALQSQANSTL